MKWTRIRLELYLRNQQDFPFERYSTGPMTLLGYKYMFYLHNSFSFYILDL